MAGSITASHAAVVLAALLASPAAADPLHHIPDAILIGSFGGSSGGGGHAPHGWFLGADTGWAWLVGASTVVERSAIIHPTSNGWSFGARAGYQLVSGLAVQARYDHLGVDAPDDNVGLSLVSAGVRYTLPAELAPFAEVMVGPALHAATTSPGAALALGLSVLATRHLTFDLTGRDVVVDIGGVHHVPSVTLGITAGFGG